MSEKLKLLLLEAALETIPPAIVNHPAVVKSAIKRRKKPAEIILDSSIHYHAMKKLPRAEKRGRPDIVHIALLEALESPLCRERMLEAYVYTIEGHAIFIDPITRIPKNYNRFIGLMEQLFKLSRVPPGGKEPLMYIKTIKLMDLLKETRASGLIILSEKCEYRSLNTVVEKALKENLAIGIGAFPHGDFEDETLKHANYCYSIYGEPLTTHIVVSRVLASAEKLLRILEL